MPEEDFQMLLRAAAQFSIPVPAGLTRADTPDRQVLQRQVVGALVTTMQAAHRGDQIARALLAEGA